MLVPLLLPLHAKARPEYPAARAAQAPMVKVSRLEPHALSCLKLPLGRSSSQTHNSQDTEKPAPRNASRRIEPTVSQPLLCAGHLRLRSSPTEPRSGARVTPTIMSLHTLVNRKYIPRYCAAKAKLTTRNLAELTAP